MPELQISQGKPSNWFQRVLFVHHLLKLAKYCTIQKEKLPLILFLSGCTHKKKRRHNLFFRLETQWDRDHCSMKLSRLCVG